MKNKYPNVSIVITNYNYGKYLSRCLRSCLSQKNVDYEVILVDDCSTDNSMEVIELFLEDIVLLKTPVNSGVAAASNLGIENSKGQYVVRVDADDFVNSDMCYFMSLYLDANHDAFGVACDYVLVDQHEDLIERKYAEKDNISCGKMYRKDLFLQLGGYNSDARHREEEELRKRLSDFYKIHYLKMPFYRYRMHDHNKTKTKEYKNTKI